ncbi:hypothetical protein ERO13_A01G095950v2 [Gossypium hirsutum]|uniref:Uncharacterized protein n=3 Tax=Gossypium TaxID=3633 RepID=A0A5D3AGE7_GOSMU|nr:hypothetical protein ERO13_A01G095950v2 [Gossypium hirsutum]TYH30566.1 hypothetical protein ES288_A01G106000v1 [Gossypium darwinii]TYI42642.1 hypothetical protein ES332_A01G113300v1 [Gossypium tomentosum]TYJ48953.1 hypothetical protein E1A91_A01G100700v1 [Gossypium mustelinum]
MFQVPMPAVQNDSNFLGDFISTLKASEGCILQHSKKGDTIDCYLW